MAKYVLSTVIVLCALLAAPAAFGQGADDCANAQAITSCTTSPGGYNGPFAYNNSLANIDGDQTHAACDFNGETVIDNDVWFCWTSEFAGDTVTAETCGSTNVDTKMAVYGPYADCAAATAACAPGDADLLDCDDDGCDVARSSVSFSTPNAGEAYLIRVGTASQAAGGPGSVDIACTLVPVELEEFSVK